VRARWIWGRREGFKSWESGRTSMRGKRDPYIRETESQYEARMRDVAKRIKEAADERTRLMKKYPPE